MGQNNLHELWALLNVLYPEVLSSSSAFDDGFRIGALYQVRLKPVLRQFNLNGSTAQDNMLARGFLCTCDWLSIDLNLFSYRFKLSYSHIDEIFDGGSLALLLSPLRPTQITVQQEATARTTKTSAGEGWRMPA